MQYAENIDEWADILIRKNSGAYANSWLLGDIKTGEIACLELGLKYHNLEKKTNGYFAGSNVAADKRILRLETAGSWDDVRDSAVARRVRWDQLLKEHYGRIDVSLAKQMLGDHYDVYLQKEQPGCRTICGHGELDDARIPGPRPPTALPGRLTARSSMPRWREVGICGPNGAALATAASRLPISWKSILNMNGSRAICRISRPSLGPCSHENAHRRLRE